MEEWLFCVTGRVQGVGFRASVIHFVRDNSLNIKGYVRNMPDYSVEVRAQGTVGELEILYHFLEQGPRMARVEKVLVLKSKNLSCFTGFDVGF